MSRYEEAKTRVRAHLMQRMDLTRDIDDQEIQDMLDEEIVLIGRCGYLSLAEKKRLGRELFYAIRKLDILQELLEDEAVTEIMVNGPQSIFIEKDGIISKFHHQFESREKLEDIIQQIVAKANRVVNESCPIVDARLQNGARVNVVLSPVALNGPILTIRRFPKSPIDMEKLLSLGSVTKEAADFLKKLVRSCYNIFISGGTGSGKTTFLNALSGYIPPAERVITIEDSAELQLRGIDNLVRLETRNANIEGCRPVTIRELIRTSLRMRPDRIIVGEVRGSEAIDMIQAMNTGHDGSLSTGHANSASDMLYRLETMILMGMELPLPAIRRQIASGVDIIIHLGRMRDHTRRVLEIVEILGYEGGEIRTASLYEFVSQGEDENGHIIGTLVKSGDLTHTEKLKLAGME
ncbi:MAG: CpaF family protein [Lachnospiraceae bacterium]|nr:CpaF family protein [Lachnospiraceae bacterium]